MQIRIFVFENNAKLFELLVGFLFKNINQHINFCVRGFFRLCEINKVMYSNWTDHTQVFGQHKLGDIILFWMFIPYIIKARGSNEWCHITTSLDSLRFYIPNVWTQDAVAHPFQKTFIREPIIYNPIPDGQQIFSECICLLISDFIFQYRLHFCKWNPVWWVTIKSMVFVLIYGR